LAQQNVQKSSSTTLPRSSRRLSGALTLNQLPTGNSGARTRAVCRTLTSVANQLPAPKIPSTLTARSDRPALGSYPESAKARPASR
jgi:hypothetical protein